MAQRAPIADSDAVFKGGRSCPQSFRYPSRAQALRASAVGSIPISPSSSPCSSSARSPALTTCVSCPACRRCRRAAPARHRVDRVDRLFIVQTGHRGAARDLHMKWASRAWYSRSSRSSWVLETALTAAVPHPSLGTDSSQFTAIPLTSSCVRHVHRLALALRRRSDSTSASCSSR